MTSTTSGYVANCVMMTRDGEIAPILERTADGEWIPRLSRYAIIPLEMYEALATASGTLPRENAKRSRAKPSGPTGEAGDAP